MSQQPPNDPAALPYWRLSGFYIVYFASLGALLPYWGLYLHDHGHSAREIGELMAVIMITKVIAPNIWGWLADRSGRPMAIIRVASLLSAIAFGGVFLSHNYWWLVLVMALFSFFWNASLPQFEAATMNYLGKDHHRYSRIRLWGSLGFIATAAGLGPILQTHSIDLVPQILLGLFILIWVASLLVSEPPPHHVPHITASLRRLLRTRQVVALMVTSFLVQLSHGPYYSFYSIYLESHGYSRSAIGGLWALGVAAEILLFLLMGWLLARFSARSLWTAAMLLTALRWLLIGLFPDSSTVMLLAQPLHAASFGVSHAIAIHLVHQYFTGPHQGRGQALYSSVSFGAGGALGALAAGLLWDSAGPTITFLCAAIAALVGAAWANSGLRGHSSHPPRPTTST